MTNLAVGTGYNAQIFERYSRPQVAAGEQPPAGQSETVSLTEVAEQASAARNPMIGKAAMAVAGISLATFVASAVTGGPAWLTGGSLATSFVSSFFIPGA